MGAAATLDVTTAFGRIPLMGRISDDPARPVLLVIRGVLLPADHMGGLVDDLADEADVLLAHLPGMHSPTLVSTDLATMTAAFREVLDTQLAGRRVVLFGMSAGGLVALGLAKAAQVKTLVLLDPFLRVEDCWALRELIVDGARPGSVLRAWFDALFGERLARDFRHLMSELPERTFVVVGEMPLEPPRPLTRLPSLTSEDERALWRAAPGVELTVCAGAGHDIPRQAPSEMMAVLRTALATVP